MLDSLIFKYTPKIINDLEINGSIKILLETFYPNLAEMDFESAFNLSFGYSTSEFYSEFESFLELPLEEQLKIIPTP